MTPSTAVPQPACPLALLGASRTEVHDTINSALESVPMRALRSALDRSRLKVEPHPILYKHLSDSLVRIMFPVTGGPVADGAVVSVVCLYDRQAARTLYAHPMHAGPRVNPLLKHLDGPMALPKAQPGDDGNRATRRIMEHKRALWDRFLRQRAVLGQEQAGRQWRNGYYWALKRLYFCSRCPQCKWGSPFFDGPDPMEPRQATVLTSTGPVPVLSRSHAAIVADIVSSDAWAVEVAYARRGGFAVAEHPCLLKRLDGDFVQVVFPTNTALVQAGALVALAVTYHRPSRAVTVAHCLCAGPEPEILFLRGDVALGLPLPQPGVAGQEARRKYQSWRSNAWSQFWLDELEYGLREASARWLSSFRAALAELFGGNDLGRSALPPQEESLNEGRCSCGGPAELQTVYHEGSL